MFIDILRNVATYGIFFSYVSIASIPLIILIFLPHSWPWIKFLYWSLIKWTSKILLCATFLPVTYQGIEPLPQKPVIFIANHESSLDIPLVASVIEDRPCVWLAKADLWNYPVLKQLLGHSGIPVSFEERTGVVQKGVDKLNTGYSVMIFPEGGRYNDGKIHPFSSGFAAMAKLSGAPIIPLYISGTGKAMPMGQHTIIQTPLIITVGKPMTCGENESIEEFKKRVRDWYVELNWRRDFLLNRFGIRICKNAASIEQVG